MLVCKRLIMGSVFCWIILEQNFSQQSFFKLGAFKRLSELGKYTYGLYCLHQIGILICLTLLRSAGWNQFSWQIWVLELPLNFILSVAISWFSFHYFESWFLKLKTRFSYITKD